VPKLKDALEVIQRHRKLILNSPGKIWSKSHGILTFKLKDLNITQLWIGYFTQNVDLEHVVATHSASKLNSATIFTFSQGSQAQDRQEDKYNNTVNSNSGTGNNHHVKTNLKISSNSVGPGPQLSDFVEPELDSLIRSQLMCLLSDSSISDQSENDIIVHDTKTNAKTKPQWNPDLIREKFLTRFETLYHTYVQELLDKLKLTGIGLSSRLSSTTPVSIEAADKDVTGIPDKNVHVATATRLRNLGDQSEGRGLGIHISEVKTNSLNLKTDVLKVYPELIKQFYDPLFTFPIYHIQSETTGPKAAQSTIQ